MTTLIDRPVDGAATHALVIGVGAYTHLLDGKPGAVLDNPMGLGQLESPPRSALKLLEFLLGPGFNPPVPLGSVEAVISAPATVEVPRPAQDGGPVEVEPAMRANIARAFDAWYGRCDTHEDNLALFYHCGHGVQKDDLALLAQDFGERPGSEWEGAYNFEQTYKGMAQCKARRQFFFVDACRQVTAEVRELAGFHVLPLRHPRLRGNRVRDSLVLFATSHDGKAHARKTKPTRFTEALLEGLEGPGAERVGRGWAVTTRSLHGGIEQALKRTAGPRVPHQDCMRDGEAKGTAVLHCLPGKPKVPARVRQEPPLVANRSSLKFSPPPPRIEVPLAPTPDAWEFALEADVYRLEAVVDGSAMVLSEEEWVVPPYYEWPPAQP